MPVFQGQIREVRNQRFYTSVVHPAKIESKVVDGKKKTYKFPSGETPLQLTAYMAYLTLENRASQFAVFPIPLTNKRNRFQVFDPNRYPSLFADLEILFPAHKSTRYNPQEVSIYSELSQLNPTTQMKVLRANVCKTLGDALKYLNQETAKFLSQFYEGGYAYLVVEFTGPESDESGETRSGGWLGPIMYVHELIGVETRGVRVPRLFLPTRHYLKTHDAWSEKYSYKESSLQHDNPFDAEVEMHGNNDDRMMEIFQRRRAPAELVPKREGVKLPPNLMGRTSVSEGSHWDHQIYVANVPRVKRNPLFEKLTVSDAQPSHLNYVRMYLDPQKMPREICQPRISVINRIDIDSSYKYKLDFWL